MWGCACAAADWEIPAFAGMTCVGLRLCCRGLGDSRLRGNDVCGIAPWPPQVRLSVIPAPVSVIAAPVSVIAAPVSVIPIPVPVIPAKAGI